jgi:hypothetical protein
MAIIMGLTGVSAPGRTAGRGGARAGGGGFALPAEGRPPAGAAPVAAMGLDGLLALQQEAVMPCRDREARRRGQDLLAALVALQRAMLGGAEEPDGLARLAELAASVPEAGDPALRQAVASLALRARLELVRRGRPDPG